MASGSSASLTNRRDKRMPEAFEPTPRQRGILDGLADRWGANPWAHRDGRESWEADEYRKGHRIGIELQFVAVKEARDA